MRRRHQGGGRRHRLDSPTCRQLLTGDRQGRGEAVREHGVRGSPQAGQTVWADTNGDGVFNPGGRRGDKDISHLIYCPAQPGPNEPPVAQDDAYTLDEDTTLAVPAPGVLANDTDTDPLTAVLVDDVTHGVLTLNPDGSLAYTPDANFHGEDPFTYQACDTASACDTATVTLTITSVNDPPVADPDGPYTGTVDQPVGFDGSGSYDIDGTIDSFEWDFGDASSGTGPAPDHTYTTAEEYTVTLTVTDNQGGTDTATTTATITPAPNNPPTAEDDAYTLDEDTTLAVPAPGVLANDTDTDTDPLTAVLVDDVTHGVLTLNPDGSLAYTPDANFHGEDPFAYQACDTTGACDTAAVSLTVRAVNDPPVADAGPDQAATVGEKVAFDGSGSSDVDNDALSYLWVLVSRPDGSTAAFDNATSVTPTFTADVSGDYTVELTVDDDNGGTDTDEVTVTASEAPNTAPVADANGPYTGTAGNAVSFDGSGSFDLDGTIVSYVWDFGDDNTGSGVAPDHTYPTPGPYTVTLTVTDDDGATATDTTNADITEAPNTAPVADANGPYTGTAGNTVSFDGSGSFDLDGTIVSYAWDFGDDNTGSGVAPDHTYPTPGPYTVTLTVTDDDGATNTDTTNADITESPNTAPVADAGRDQAATVGDTVALDGSGSSDVDNDPLTFAWIFLARPPGSAASLTNPTSVTPSFTPDLPGDYSIELTVDDGNGGTATDTVTITAAAIGMAISLEDSLVGVGRTTEGTITLDNPAPPGGITVTLSLDTAIATVDPTDVPIAEGATKGAFVLAGVAVGATTITGTSPVTETATADVQVTDSLISIDDIPIIAPEESADLPVSITKPAPPGGVTIHLESLDPTIATTDPTVFVPEGLYVPTANPQITGVAFGTTEIKATALAYGPDVRDVTVALHVTLTPAELDVPELWTLQVTAHLSAPAPSGGVTIDLSLDEPLATVPASVFIPAGQTLSGPIDITGGTTLGTTVLRASGLGLIEGATVVNVIDTPDVWVTGDVDGPGSSYNSYSSYRLPFEVGVDLQIDARVRFEVAPPGPVDVVVSVPAGSGVLLSASPDAAGSESLVVATGFTSTSTGIYYLQGTIQGDDIDDDVPVTIDVFETGTTTPVGYEQADMPSAVDVGPSGFSFPASTDLDVPTFPNEQVDVRSYLLYDGESGTLHNRRWGQDTRGGHTITVEMTNTDPGVGEVLAPAVFTGGDYQAYAEFDGLTPGTTTLGIIQPPGHTTPANGYTTRTLNVTAPDVWVTGDVDGPGSSYNSYFSYRLPFEVGVDLQIDARVRFEVAPPGPVDVVVSVPAGSGVLLSASPDAAGSESLVVATGFTSTSTGIYYLQGTIQGDDIDDDVPVTIDVFETGTTTRSATSRPTCPRRSTSARPGSPSPQAPTSTSPTFPERAGRCPVVPALRRRVGHAAQPALGPGHPRRPHHHRRDDQHRSRRRRGAGARGLHRRRLPGLRRVRRAHPRDHHPGDHPTPRSHHTRQRLHHPHPQRHRPGCVGDGGCGRAG